MNYIKKNTTTNINDILINEFRSDPEALGKILLVLSKNLSKEETLSELVLELSNKSEILGKVIILLNSNPLPSSDKKSAATSKKSKKDKGKAKRPLRDFEYKKIMNLLNTGFTYYDNKLKRDTKVRPNKKVALALLIEANIGLRVSDVVKLKVKDVIKGEIYIREKKTNKLQVRRLNNNLVNIIEKYSEQNNLRLNDLLIKLTERQIQRIVKKVVDYSEIKDVSTHSFRKYFAMSVYVKTKDILLVQQLLNHSSLGVTQRYLSVNQDLLDEISSSVDFTEDFLLNIE